MYPVKADIELPKLNVCPNLKISLKGRKKKFCFQVPPNTQMITYDDCAAAQILNSFTVTEASRRSGSFKNDCWENSCEDQEQKRCI